ncbi:MAG: hypothetical protein HeimC2_44960 [Candidatus Heimdallarchaeota archaeon LC_2]|nr:MAG: hypothetical protein HeimC2_44960 [Candidatus Heimdallarchaeota archaeon LC_2]
MVLLVTGLFAFLSRLILPQPSDSDREIWVDVRQKLQAVLIENKIIPGSPISISTSQLKPVFLDDSDSQELSIQINPTFIQELRDIGLDGILICLYLLKQRESYCSIKVIQKHLNIPMTTVYRNIAKLENSQYVDSQYSFDDSGKAYYKITYQGEELMFDFYDLIHLPGTSSQQIVTQIANVCSGCGASYSTIMDFCGECGIKL